MPEPSYPFPDPWQAKSEPLFPNEPVIVPLQNSADAADAEEDEEGIPLGRILKVFFSLVVFLAVIAGVFVFVWKVFLTEDGIVADNAEDTEPLPPNEKIIGVYGGEVYLEDGASIMVPEGALDRNILISIEKVDEGENETTDIYHLKPDFLVFIKPVLVKIPYGAALSNTKEKTLDLYVFESKDALKTAVKTELDTENKFAVTELAVF